MTEPDADGPQHTPAGDENAPAAARTPPPGLRGRLRGALRLAATIVLFVVLIAGVEVALGGATAVAHELGYTGSVAEFARLLSLGLYAAMILAFVVRRR